MLCNVWQLIKLVNMNHNKYPSFCEVLSQKWWWTKWGIKLLLKQWDEAKCIQELALIYFPKNNNTICPISFAQKFGLVLYIGDHKEALPHSHTGRKCFYLGNIKTIMFLLRTANQSGIELLKAPTFECTYNH